MTRPPNPCVQLHPIHPPRLPVRATLTEGYTRSHFGPPQPDRPAASVGDYCSAVLMVGKKGPGRTIYDQIKLLPEGDRCPLCDQRNVSTLDHILPKTLYPALAVAPDNLVGACFECNKAKLATAPVTPQDTLLHPYFDDVSHEQWLKAGIVPQAPPAVIFRVEAPHSWPADLTISVRHQFDIFGLPSLYSSEAAREISNIRHNLQTHFDAGGTGAVQNELMRQWYSRRANRLNSWQTATYEALAHDAWFCDGGFA